MCSFITQPLLGVDLKLERFPEEALLRRGTIIRIWVFFFRDPVSVGG